MTSRSKSRDIQDSLKNPTRRARLPGELPYPVEHAKDPALDNWNHMFLRSMLQSLTLRHYVTPPSSILDLGCGSGLWVIEAAQQWTTSTFTGFDYRQIQPNLRHLCKSQPGLSSLADRIHWMHGNLLDALPFKSNSFDLVRVCGIGLGVPEDEWHYLLQEVARVLKPGAFIEIIEEDLMFPCGAESIKESDYRSSGRKPRIPEDSSPKAMTPVTRTVSRTSLLTTRSTSSRLATMSIFQADIRKSASPDTRASSLFPRPTISELLDPRDHTKLKAAWDRMLYKKFLAPGLLSVLQFYFSAVFEEVQTHPVLRVILPMNSQLTFDDASPPHSPVYQRTRGNSISSMLACVRYSTATTSEAPTLIAPPDVTVDGYGPKAGTMQGSGTVVTSSWASMHLAKALGTIQGCKEAIWSEYRDLDGPETEEDRVSDLRKEFLAAWNHWECDMKDRIGMRPHVQSTLAWSTSVLTDSPDWKAWRNRVGYLNGVDDADPYVCETDTCRAIRGFVGRKPFQDIVA